MTWAEIAKIKLKNDWVYTSPVEGDYFRIKHDDFPTGGSFSISQFDSNGKIFGHTIIKAGLFPEILYLPKPKIATTRKLGIKLISAIPWEINIEVSDYISPQSSVDLSPIASQLNSISIMLAEIDDAIADIPPTDLTTVHNKLNLIVDKLGKGRETISITTPSIAPNTVYNTTIPLGKTFLLLSVKTSSSAWIRLYTSLAYQSADAQRSITQNSTNTPNGIISEDITTPSNLTIDLNGNGKFQGVGSSQESPPNVNIPVTIVNTSNLSQVITVSYNRILLES